MGGRVNGWIGKRRVGGLLGDERLGGCVFGRAGGHVNQRSDGTAERHPKDPEREMLETDAPLENREAEKSPLAVQFLEGTWGRGGHIWVTGRGVRLFKFSSLKGPRAPR